jgi:hypothetical protein
MSEFSSTTSPLSTTTEAPVLIMSSNVVPLHHVVTIRLKKTNYLLWRAQLLPYLRSTDLMGFLDDTNAAPEQKILASSVVDAALIDNPDYASWYNKDQQVLSGFLSSMSEEILREVISAKTSKDAWTSLQKFSTSTRACMVQLRIELATAQKNNLSASLRWRRPTPLYMMMRSSHICSPDYLPSMTRTSR